ncbi:MAG: hypothetical protein KBG05_06835 [Lachnospiraceae bacterium]|nr:hypothetical protein [Lachnospiraceae bacterium]MBS7329935.1 hypothetical protein [Lachnospiraceae bacterium]MDD7548751.1 hypothetical protein [Lachnospiraceae bacterium]
MIRNLRLPEYVYKLSPKEITLALLKGIAVEALLTYFFYRSLIWGIILIPIIPMYALMKLKEVTEKKKWEILLQFKEMLASVNNSIQAGYSIENAFISCRKDMLELYGGDAVIVKELSILIQGMKNNCTVTGMLMGMANHTGIEEIREYASVMTIAKSSGTRIREIMDSYIKTIDEKLSVMQEIETMTSRARYEQQIMNAVPFVILMYVDTTNKGFFDVLYSNILGNIVMSVTLTIYIVSILISRRIINIEL